VATSDLLVGALVTTFAVIGFGEAARAARWFNVPLGAWLLIAPWILTSNTSSARWNDMAVGALIIVLTVRRGSVQSRFGSWDRFVV
jgi:hypothetical protein